MSTILIAVLILLGTIVPTVLFTFISRRKQNKRLKTLIHSFSRSATGAGLNISSQELLKQKIIGLDGIKGFVLVHEFAEDNTVIKINLSDVRSCIHQKEFDTVDVGTKKNPILKQHLRAIGLKFNFRDNSSTFIAFYEAHINGIYEMQELTAKAKTWETMLSKLLNKATASRA